jgi:flagellar hook-associated protein 2
MAVDYISAINTKGSGMNLTQIVDGLVTAETAPLKSQAETKLASHETAISELGKVVAELDTLKSAMEIIGENPMLEISDDNEYFAMDLIDSNAASSFNYDLEVVQLAEAQVLEFSGYTSTTSTVGTGTITIDFGTWSGSATNTFSTNTDATSVTLTVSDSTLTLAELAEELDALDGITASVIQTDNNSYSLVIKAEQGAENAIRMTVVEGSTTGLSAFDTTSDNYSYEVQAAADAIIKLDSITVTRSSNRITDLLPGYGLTLTATTDSAITAKADRSDAYATQLMSLFVDQINTTLSMLKTSTSRGYNGAGRGALAGDVAATALQSQLRAVLQAPIAGFASDDVYLSDFGVSTNTDGSLSFDETEFLAKFQDDPTSLDALFKSGFTSSSTLVKPAQFGTLEPTPGAYDFTFDSSTNEFIMGSKTFIKGTNTDGDYYWSSYSGDTQGTRVTISGSGTASGTIYYGTSLADLLANFVSTVTDEDELIDRRLTQLDDDKTAATDEIAAIETRMESIRTRYSIQFSAMEALITNMKSTGSFMTSMMDAWNNSNN